MDCCNDESRSGASRCGACSVWSHRESFLAIPYPLDVHQGEKLCLRGHRVAHLAKECPAATPLPFLTLTSLCGGSMYVPQCLSEMMETQGTACHACHRGWCGQRSRAQAGARRGGHAAAIDTRCALPTPTPDLLWLVDRRHWVPPGRREGGHV